MKIKCYALFDITRTNVVSSRRSHERTVDPSLAKQRSQQSNFETVLQVINMRVQPEFITDPERLMDTLDTYPAWGSEYSNKSKIPVWSFVFEVSQPWALHDGVSDIGNLYTDGHGIPIVTGLDEWIGVANTINTSTEYKNIYFEVIPHDRQDNQ